MGENAEDVFLEPAKNIPQNVQVGSLALTAAESGYNICTQPNKG